MAGVSIDLPPGYVLLAPLGDVLDAVTVLSAQQHLAGIAGALAICVMWRLAKGRSNPAPWRGHFFSVAMLAASMAGIHYAAAHLPRPMARLSIADANVVRIDFHSHSSASRDANPGFSEEKNRAWHMAGGYDVVFLTDHDTAPNPAHRFDGVTVLPGIEANLDGEHVGLLGSAKRIRDYVTQDLHDLDPSAGGAHGKALEPAPIIIWNHPRGSVLTAPRFFRDPATIGLRGIEISNAAPHAMDLIREQHEAIVAYARKHNLALISGTDNHGWGNTAPNWTLLQVPHWRELSSDELENRIEQVLRRRGYGATHVVERSFVDPGRSRLALTLTIVTVPWRMLTTLSLPERLMWLVWIWTAACLAALLRLWNPGALFRLETSLRADSAGRLGSS